MSSGQNKAPHEFFLPTAHCPSPTARRGIGLVELLVTLAITAGLLTAAAVALDASLKAYSINQTQSDTLHRTRMALHRLSTYIRTSTEHAPHTAAQADDFAHGAAVDDTGIALFDENDVELRFHYDSVNQQLIVTENGTDHVLLRGVTAFNIHLIPTRSANSIKTGGVYDLLKQATFTLTVHFADDTANLQSADTGHTITLSTSVTPRRIS